LLIDQRIERLLQSIESRDRQIDALAAQIAALKSSTMAVVANRNYGSTAIQTLARIAEGRGRQDSSRQEAD
jgi:hypothetical protein